ncbi:MAG: ADP-forming succinate--CoA ligase subunit beta [marine benthic group bacterium]|nr:ADP-forming succinate--CoA ligase subunit beta [Gemmatimonadota bacterium]
MNIHEYQAREILRAHGVPVPPGEIATTPEEAERIAAQYGGMVVVKAQVHAGGRGKAGGVKLAVDPADAREKAGAILGIEIKGLTVEKILVAPAEDIETEAYLGIVMDRGSQSDVIMVSSEGGIDIEEVAATNPDAIQKLAVDARYGLLPHQAAALAHGLYSDAKLARQAARIIMQLYEAYRAAGCTLAEINPLITTPGGEVKAIDAKMNIDDNALFRLPDVAAMRDEAAEDPAERKAREAGLSYIQLDGDVGCCVNGAGLAMATMDLVKHYGGDPANFLDIGGSSNPDKVVTAFEIITSDPNVKSILFNIFGGITRCDDVANGIVEATRRIDVGLPIAIRLTGTNEDLAVEILKENGFEAMTDMDEVVKRAVTLAAGAAS